MPRLKPPSAAALRASLAARRAARIPGVGLRRRFRLAVAPVPAPTRQKRLEGAFAEVFSQRPEPSPVEPGTRLSDLLLARLQAGDRDRIVGAMAGSAEELHALADTGPRRRLELAHAAAFGPEDVRERLGLLTAMPPDDVHSMARDWTATGGDFFLGDLVAGALAAAGAELPQGGTLLDFGSSSGRVLRVFAAARPDLRCLGCDPNGQAIAWASAHLPGEYVVSSQRPPLALADASVDATYAISIWSHFAEEPALEWLREMRRVVRPGGALLLTTHGWDQLAAGLRTGTILPEAVGAAAEGLLARGHHFIDVFGADGDWGVVDAGWGNAYATAEWLADRVTGDWSVDVLWPGAVEGAQDLYVLRRR